MHFPTATQQTDTLQGIYTNLEAECKKKNQMSSSPKLTIFHFFFFFLHRANPPKKKEITNQFECGPVIYSIILHIEKKPRTTALFDRLLYVEGICIEDVLRHYFDFWKIKNKILVLIIPTILLLLIGVSGIVIVVVEGPVLLHRLTALVLFSILSTCKELLNSFFIG